MSSSFCAGGVKDMQSVLNLVWDLLLPALQDAPLPPNDQAQERLQRKLASLSLPLQQGQPFSPLTALVSGKVFVFPANDQQVGAIALEFAEAGGMVTMHDDRDEHRIACSINAWLRGTTTLYGDSPQPLAASGAWTAKDTYVMRLCFYETPFCPRLTFRFNQDPLLFDYEDNVGFGPTQRPQLAGNLR